MKSPLQTYTDEYLFQLLCEGSREALSVLYERYWKLLYIKACQRIHSKEMVEEIIQDLFVNLWMKRDTLFIQSSFSGYIFTALKNRILNYLQTQAIHIKHQRYQYKQAQQQNLYEDDSTQQQIQYLDLFESYQQSVASLPEKSRVIFELNRNGHFTIAQIAQQLSISPKTVEYHLSRSLQELKKKLKDFLPLVLFICQIIQANSFL